MRCGLTSLALLGWVSLASAAPSIVYPLAEQKPPVARVGSPFVFDLLPGTFASNATISYSASGLPSWLKFDDAQAVFVGTPASKDVGTANVTVSARDSTGTAQSSFSLVVSSSPAPTVALGFSAQIADEDVRQFASAKVMPDGSGITVPPQWSFSLGWAGTTFASSSRLYYSAHIRGTTSLPDWLEFSNTTFTFNGVAPANAASYPVVVTATDIWGYTGVEDSFVLAVGNGVPLEFGQNLTALNTTAFNKVNYTFDTSTVTLNGTAANSSQFVISPNLSLAKWLSFDNKTNSITGTVPESMINGTVAPLSIPVSLSPTNASNTLTNEQFLTLNIVPYYFTTNHLPNATTTNGTTFTYNIEQYIRNKDVKVNATVVPHEAASWLVYYPENYTLVGHPPSNLSYDGIDVEFFGIQGNVTGSTTMRMDIVGPSAPPATGTPTPVPQGKLDKPHSNTKKIIIGVVVGVGGFLILLALLLFCFCRRRKDTSAKPVDDEKPPLDEKRTPRNSVLTGIPGFGATRGAERPASLGVNTLPKSPAKSATDSETTCAATPTTPDSKLKVSVAERSPRRLAPIKGLFGPGDDENTQEALESQRDLSFMGKPEPIAVRKASDKAPVPVRSNHMSSEESGESLESWESPRSFHWSDEDHYLPPLMPTASGTPTPTVGLTDEPRAPPIAVTAPDSEQARPLPGFYPRFPRRVRPGDPAPFISSDDIPTSYSEFSELDRNRSSYSLDSFRDPGSALGTLSTQSHFDSTGRDTFSSRHEPTDSHDSNDSGSSFQAPSGLGRFTSSGVLSTGTFSSDEPAVVATAMRAPVESQPQRVVRAQPSVDLNAPRPLSVLAGPIMPAGLQPAPRRNVSSSRRSNARIHSTREHIVGPSTPVPAADEHLAYVGDTDDESPMATIRR